MSRFVRTLDEDFAVNLFEKSPLTLAVEWIAENLVPEDIFTDSQLEEWAEANGYVKE